jgi:hypothetical protein
LLTLFSNRCKQDADEECLETSGLKKYVRLKATGNPGITFEEKGEG